MRTEEALEAFVVSGQARGWRPKTETWFRYMVGHLGDGDLPERPEPIEAVLAALNQRGLASKTRHGAWRALRIFYKWVAARYGVTDVMLAIGAPVHREGVVPALTRGETDRLLWKSQRNRRNYALLLFFLDTGARLGEVAGLGWADLQEEGESAWTVRLEGKTGERRVPVSARLMAALEMYRGHHQLWVGQQGPLTADGLQMVVRRCMAAARLKGGPHLLRHTFAKLYLMNGGDLISLQRLLGHRDIKMTERYVDLDMRDLQEQHAKYSPLVSVAEGEQLRLLEASDG